MLSTSSTVVRKHEDSCRRVVPALNSVGVDAVKSSWTAPVPCYLAWLAAVETLRWVHADLRRAAAAGGHAIIPAWPTSPASLPIARTPDPAAAPPLGWGVLAPGRIAGAFVDALHSNTRQRLVAVGSRSAERAASFAATFDAERSYGSYEQLVADPDVDVVYVASPHSEHHAQALLAIAAGKPVLVEKAFCRNAIEAREVVQAARAAGCW